MYPNIYSSGHQRKQKDIAKVENMIIGTFCETFASLKQIIEFDPNTSLINHTRCTPGGKNCTYKTYA